MLILLAQSEHLAIVRLTVEIMRYKQPVVPRAGPNAIVSTVSPVVGEKYPVDDERHVLWKHAIKLASIPP